MDEKKLKIAIIGTAGIPAQYGGFETLAENLVKNKTGDIQYTVFCSAKLYRKRQNEYLGAKLKYITLPANGMGSILYDLIGMLLSLRSDVMLILGVSGSLFLPFIRLLYRGKIVTNIDGIEWKRNKWNQFARFILHISEIMAVKFSNIIIGDNQGILDYITREYNKKAVLIEYGADHVDKKNTVSYFEKYSFCSEKYAVSVCRIEPENNIHFILEAFSRQKYMLLVVIGNWQNSNYGSNLLKIYNRFKNIFLLDPIYESNELNFLRSHACLYIHGHSAGGTNPSLVEAMFLGLPVFAFDCVYNRYTTENQCVYWASVDKLYTYIIQRDKLQLGQMGKKMKMIADNKYRWDGIVSKYEALYK
jgi:glycosyltransferase involved in cell wall biosynthesis